MSETIFPAELTVYIYCHRSRAGFVLSAVSVVAILQQLLQLIVTQPVFLNHHDKRNLGDFPVAYS